MKFLKKVLLLALVILAVAAIALSFAKCNLV